MKTQVKSVSSLAKCIDHTFLRPDGPPEAILRLCEEARRYEFATVAVNPAEIARAKAYLEGSPVQVCTTIGFPLGQNTTATKLFETENAIKLGAGEIDMVINQRALRAGDVNLVREEIFGIASICRDNGVLSKVILECCNLTDEEKILVCELASLAKCDFVKTSTGFGAHGATLHDVALMRKHSDPNVQVKASGGIRDLATALAMLDAGATRIGTSASVSIIQEFGAAS